MPSGFDHNPLFRLKGKTFILATHCCYFHGGFKLLTTGMKYNSTLIQISQLSPWQITRKLFRWPGPCVPNPWRPQWSLFPQRLFLKQAGATKHCLVKPEQKLIFCVNQMSLYIIDQGREIFIILLLIIIRLLAEAQTAGFSLGRAKTISFNSMQVRWAPFLFQ